MTAPTTNNPSLDAAETNRRGHEADVDVDVDADESPEAPHTPRGPIERLVLGAISLYRLTAPARMPRCRYIPSCSAYAVEAVEVHGLGRGSWLAIRRLGRCHPFGSFGFDPVPERRDRPADADAEQHEHRCDDHNGHQPDSEHHAEQPVPEHQAPENSTPPERT